MLLFTSVSCERKSFFSERASASCEGSLRFLSHLKFFGTLVGSVTIILNISSHLMRERK